MTKLVSLELDYSIKVSSRIHDYLSPDFVYFPLTKTSELLIKDGESVLKGQGLYKDEHKITYCTVSGRVAGIKRFTTNNIPSNYLVVENDYKEKVFKKSTRKLLKVKNLDELHSLLKDYGITFEFKAKNTLLLNGIDSEPYILNKSMFLNQNLTCILETLDFLKDIIGYKNVLILLKNTETLVLTKTNDLLGTYPDFRVVMVPNYYLIEKKENYKNYIEEPIESIFELDLNNFIKISEIVEKNKTITEKYITITGDGIKNPLVINAKIGSLIKNIISEEIKYLDDYNKLVFYYNGMMKGNVVTELNNVVVDEDFEGLIIAKDIQPTEEKCIKCGLCLKYCPLKICPIDYYNAKKNIECIKCGLCSYVCPSNINFKNITYKEDKHA